MILVAASVKIYLFILQIYKVVLFLLILSLGVIAGLIFAKQDAMRYTMDRALQGTVST